VGRPVRESAEAKGRRYITEGRLLLRAVDPSEIVASCRGNGAIYRVGYANSLASSSVRSDVSLNGPSEVNQWVFPNAAKCRASTRGSKWLVPGEGLRQDFGRVLG
jgi:hypothetical protein